METKSLNCSSCGAPISIPNDIDYLNCSSCGTYLSVQRGEGYVALKMVEQVTEKIEQVGQSTETAIRDGTTVTQAELQRLQVTQEIAMMEMQLSNLRSEIRGVQRVGSSKEATQQLYELHFQEYEILERLRQLYYRRDSLGSKNPKTDPQLIKSQISSYEAQVTALNGCNPRDNRVKSLLTQTYRNTLRSNYPPKKPEQLTDIPALKSYLSMVEADLQKIGKVRPKGVVKSIKSELQVKKRHLIGKMRILERERRASQSSSTGIQQKPNIKVQGVTDSQKNILKGCALGIVPVLVMVCIGFVLFGTYFVGQSEQMELIGMGVLSIMGLVGIVIGSWLFLRTIVPGGKIMHYIFSAEQEKRKLVAVLFGGSIWIGFTWLFYTLSMMIESTDASLSFIIIGSCLSPIVGIVAALMVLQPKLGIWKPVRSLVKQENQKSPEKIDEPIPPPH